MSAYEALAGVYDRLTGDVGYERRADYIEKLFLKSRIPVHTVLDLACGTGTMTWILTDRGYELIGEAVAAMRDAKAHHDRMEQLHSAVMDWESYRVIAEDTLDTIRHIVKQRIDAAKKV